MKFGQNFPAVLPLTLFSALLLQACGGGGGSASSNINISGIAALGAPMVGARVQIYDANGAALLATAATVSASGSYSASIPSNAKFPLVIITDDGVQPVVSVVTDPSQSGQVNVNQLTNLIAARLSPSGDPVSLVNQIAANLATVNNNTLSAQKQSLNQAIQPLLSPMGLPNIVDPVAISFTPNGTGFDKLLDTLDVKISPNGTSSTIDITVRKSIAEDAELPNVTFSSNSAIAALPAVNANELVANGLSVKIQDLLDQMTRCFALPKNDRVSNTQGTAASVTAADCKAIFFANDPSRYRSSGSVVAFNQHFSGLFSANPGVKFIAPKYFYTVSESVPNGPQANDVVFGYRWQDEYGNFQYERNVARQDTDGKYRIIGNQYRYPGGVSPYAQRREFIKDPNYTYNSVGYVFDIPCNNNTKNWVKVVITTPPINSAGDRGDITMMPNVTNGVCNYSYFTVSPDDINPSGTGFIRLQSKFESAAPVSHPRVKEGSFLAFVDTDFTDAQIEKAPQFGTWKFEYFFSGNNTNTPDATQYFKTIARAKTVDGFRASVPLPTLTSTIPNINYQAAGSLTLVQHPSIGYFVQPGNKLDLTWRVASDSIASIKGSEPATYRARIYGSYGAATAIINGRGIRAGYEDSVTFGSASRSKSLFCGEGQAAPQCEAGNFISAPYATTITDIDLISRTNDGSDASQFYTFRKYSN